MAERQGRDRRRGKTRRPTGSHVSVNRRSAGGGGGGAWLALLILAGLIAGGLFFWDKIEARMHSRRPAVSEPAEETGRDEISFEVIDKDGNRRTVEPRKPPPEAIAKAAIGTGPTRPLRGADDGEARALFEKAESLVEEGDFSKAAKLLSKCKVMDLGADTYRKARDHYRRADLFADVVERNPVETESDASDLYQFQVRNMGTFRGVVTSQQPDRIKIRKNNGIVVTIKPDQVVEQKAITQKERTAELLQDLADRKALTPPTGAGRWQLACFALRSGLREEATFLLKDAWELDDDLVKTVYEERARQVLRRWVYYMGAEIEHKARKHMETLEEDYAKSEALALARKMLKEEKEIAAEEARTRSRQAAEDKKRAVEIAAIKERARREAEAEKARSQAESMAARKRVAAEATARQQAEAQEKQADERASEGSSRRGGSGGGSLERQAETAFRTGLRLFSEGSSHPSLAEGRRLIADAADELQKAVDLYGKLAAQNPDKASEYRRKQGDAQRKLRWARNFRRIG